MASVLDEEVFIGWAPSWGGSTHMLGGLRPFEASVWHGQDDSQEPKYAWRISIGGVKFKRGYATEEEAKANVMRILRICLTRGLAHLDKHEAAQKAKREQEKAMEGAKKRRRPKPLEDS